MDGLLQKFPPGLTTPPHRYVTLALAAVAQHNGRLVSMALGPRKSLGPRSLSLRIIILFLATGFVPFLNDILSRAVPLFNHIKQDPIKGAWSQALCAFSESVIESTTDQGQEAMTPGRGLGYAFIVFRA